MPYQVFLKKGEERDVLNGRPWVYANEALKISGKDENGGVADVYAADGKYLGSGYINHFSKILVRIFSHVKGELDDPERERQLILNRIASANEMRKSLGFKDNYRAVFAEADGLPALIVDRYGEYLSVQFLSLGMDKRKNLIVSCLKDVFSPLGIYERSDVAVRGKEGLSDSVGELYGEVPDEIIIDENGVKMSVDVRRGQKTGYFLDQKENRFAVRRYAKGEVLDCFSNSGGFSMNAALTADSVTAIDISETALQNVRRNAELNGFHNVKTLNADVFEALRKFKAEGKKFDTVILDPPAFCKSADKVNEAYRGYRDINLIAMKLVKPNGYLVTSSCSHYMTLPLFLKMIAESAKLSGRTVKCVEIKTQSPDHPSLMSLDETNYLKFVVLQVI